MRLEGRLLRGQGQPQLQYRTLSEKTSGPNTGGYQVRPRPQVGPRPRLALPAPCPPARSSHSWGKWASQVQGKVNGLARISTCMRRLRSLCWGDSSATPHYSCREDTFRRLQGSFFGFWFFRCGGLSGSFNLSEWAGQDLQLHPLKAELSEEPAQDWMVWGPGGGV